MLMQKLIDEKAVAARVGQMNREFQAGEIGDDRWTRDEPVRTRRPVA